METRHEQRGDDGLCKERSQLGYEQRWELGWMHQNGSHYSRRGPAGICKIMGSYHIAHLSKVLCGQVPNTELPDFNGGTMGSTKTRMMFKEDDECVANSPSCSAS